MPKASAALEKARGGRRRRPAPRPSGARRPGRLRGAGLYVFEAQDAASLPLRRRLGRIRAFGALALPPSRRWVGCLRAASSAPFEAQASWTLCAAGSARRPRVGQGGTAMRTRQVAGHRRKTNTNCKQAPCLSSRTRQVAGHRLLHKADPVGPAGYTVVGFGAQCVPQVLSPPPPPPPPSPSFPFAVSMAFRDGGRSPTQGAAEGPGPHASEKRPARRAAGSSCRWRAPCTTPPGPPTPGSGPALGRTGGSRWPLARPRGPLTAGPVFPRGPPPPPLL